MARSVSTIDYKVQQAEFFLGKLEECGDDFFGTQCFADAFVSACRSITFSVQTVCKEIAGFEDWYKSEQNRMKNDPLFVFFKDYRDASIHIGCTPVNIFAGKSGERKFFFMPSEDITNVPNSDVLTACQDCFKSVLDLVLRLYLRFPTYLDDRWHYTKQNYDSRGLSIDDALQSLGFPKDWACLDGTDHQLNERWLVLRRTQTSGPLIQEIFKKYLHRVIEGPDELDS